MTRTMVYLPDELHRTIKHLAVERRTSFAKLVAEALEALYHEDAEDFRIGRRRLAGYLRYPTKAAPYTAYRAKRLNRTTK